MPYNPDDHLALSVGDTKEFGDVNHERFARFAKKAALPDRLDLQTVRETAARIRDLWPRHEPARGLPDHIRQAIDAHKESVTL